MCAAQLAKQGLVGQTLAFINEIGKDAVEACFHGPVAEEVERPWILNLLFMPNEIGLRARHLFAQDEVLKCVQKSPAGDPELGIRAARFTPGPLLRNVLVDSGHSLDQVREYWGRGKGKGGKGKGSSPAGVKRGAERRPSAVAQEEGRERKK